MQIGKMPSRLFTILWLISSLDKLKASAARIPYQNDYSDKSQITNSTASSRGLFSSNLNEVEVWFWSPENGAENHLTLKPHEDVTAAKRKLLNYKFDDKRKIKIIVNGFSSKPGKNFPPFVAAFFAVPDRKFNVFAVNWYELARWYYPGAVERVPKVGEYVGNFLANVLLKDMGINPSSIHIIGHSLGSHVAGNIGRTIDKSGGKGKVSRITALDPASPSFAVAGTRVSRSDASFVDVIHTNGGELQKGGLSTYEPLGHVDFYPNGGGRQPGCGNTVLDTLNNCSHKRAWLHYIESIGYVGQPDKFKSQLCDGYEDYKSKSQTDCYDRYLNMGEGLTKESHTDNGGNHYYLYTNEKAPFTQ